MPAGKHKSQTRAELCGTPSRFLRAGNSLRAASILAARKLAQYDPV
jgi:hypothetical protein